MLTYIKINGFKSFHQFEMKFTPFTVIAGVNASGKSNLFDALKLLARLAETDNLKKAFKEQRGDFMELFTQYAENEYATEMEFCVEMLVNQKVKDAWGNQTQLKYTRLRYDLKIKRFTNSSGIEDLAVISENLVNLKHQEDQWIKLIDSDKVETWRPKVIVGKRGRPYIETAEDKDKVKINLYQDGSDSRKISRVFNLHNAIRTVLSSVDTIDFPHVLAAKTEMQQWRFLGFNPDDLRQPTNKNTGEDILSQSGKNLAAVLHRIKQDDDYTLIEISRKLQTFLPNFIGVTVIDDAENRQYVIKVKDKDKKEYSSKVLSEGTLRVLALCILEYDSQHTGLLCFEEPENGIHPFLIKPMATLLKALSNNFKDVETPLRQVIVNTHSPILVGNILELYMDDKNVSIHLSRMVNRVTTIENRRIGVSITNMDNPFEGYTETAGGIFTQIEQKAKMKYALSNVKQYLETSDFSQLKGKLN
jgi:predicted ATPase